MREILNPGWSDSRTLVGRGAGRAAVDRISTGAMFAINVFSLILIHVLSVVVLSTCRNEYTATNVSAVGVTVSPVYSGSTDCDCKCDVSVNTAAQNLPVTADVGTCAEDNNKVLAFLITVTVINAILLVALVVIVVLYGVFMFRRQYVGPKAGKHSVTTNINDAYGLLNINDDDTYSNHGYSHVEATGTEVQIRKTDEDTYSNHQCYSIVEAVGTDVQNLGVKKTDDSNLGYSVVEAAGTEAQRLSTAFLLPSGASDSEENEYSYTDMRFPYSKKKEKSKPGKEKMKQGKGKGDKLEQDKGEKTVEEGKAKSEPGKKMAEPGKEKGVTSEPGKEMGVTSEPGKEKEKPAQPEGKDKADKKATKAENQDSSGEPTGGKGPVVVVSKVGAKNAHDDGEPTAAANPFGVALKSMTESSSSLSATVVSKPKTYPKLGPSKASAAQVSKPKKDQKPIASSSAAAAESKASRAKTSFIAKFKKDTKASKPTASAANTASAEKGKKKDTKAKSGGVSGK